VIGIKVWVYKGENIGGADKPVAAPEPERKPRRSPRAAKE